MDDEDVKVKGFDEGFCFDYFQCELVLPRITSNMRRCPSADHDFAMFSI